MLKSQRHWCTVAVRVLKMKTVLKKYFSFFFLKDVVLITCQTEKEPMRDEESRQTDLTHAFIEDCRSSLRLSFTRYRLETVLAGKTNGFYCLVDL